ncbi:hypothetical protein J1N35_007508 [Gossypium stocksii]|uniref:Regulator of Vps4 activity in the MVB pathway protein n=1 Tax=Gossypium stocksii TaxID=47602 RepID=A0A9D3W9B2_9ROSI|nr:hypothetical protein J1N35_007508 [Gossypium stocksii]
MFDLFLKPKFYSRCKSALRVNKVRLETIKKKRNTVEKYLKKDIADLLRNRLYYNAYGRTEGLLVERNRTTCYKFIEQFSELILKHVSAMQKQSECPEECKEAVSSLIYAAARFADLPELRTLRTLFTEKYGNSLEPYLNQEFVQKLQGAPPAKEMKLQLMHVIAKEFSIEWDSKALEQKLFKLPSSEQKEAQHKSLNEGGDHGYKLNGSKNDTIKKSNNHIDENGLSNMQEYGKPIRNEMDRTSRPRKEVADAKLKQHRSSSSEGAFEKSNNHDDDNRMRNIKEYGRLKRNEKDLTSHTRKEVADDKKLHGSSEGELTDQDILMTSSTSEASVSDDGTENRKPFYYKFISPPSVKPSVNFGKEKNSSEELKAPIGNIDAEEINKPDDSAVESKPKPRSVRTRRLKPPPDLVVGLQSAKPDPSSSPGNAAPFPKEVSSPTEAEGRHTQASSFERDMFPKHANRKLPEYDGLGIRLGAIHRGKRN